MPAGNWIMYGNALEQILDGAIDLDSNAFRMVLLTASYTPGQNTHTAYSSLSTAEVANGNGYATHGKLLTVTTTRTGGAVAIDCDDQAWASSTFSAKYAAIVKDADANGALVAGDIPVMYCDLETGGGSLSPSNGTLSITINAAGLYTITAAAS